MLSELPHICTGSVLGVPKNTKMDFLIMSLVFLVGNVMIFILCKHFISSPLETDALLVLRFAIKMANLTLQKYVIIKIVIKLQLINQISSSLDQLTIIRTF